MADANDNKPKQDNIKGLVQDLVEKLDHRMEELRKGTAIETVRPSDAKVFMLASRHPRNISAIAAALGISRQAAHMSAQRLIERGVIELKSPPNNNKDKIIHITEEGQKARKLAGQKLNQIEAELEAKIGKDKLEQLRGLLIEVLRDDE